ncbi:glycosyltransferase family 2 protein [Streptomyces sp. NPDC060035]|uniref:glycosyltransferase family 2 protein n=1 Tax=Streptomyces sp. NPDC060035 TaxID=3347044 RepID=UPI0036933D18
MTGVPQRAELTVVTVTRNRPELIPQVIETVRAQDYPHAIEHLVVVDEDEERYREVAESSATSSGAFAAPRTVRWHFARRRPGDRSGPPVLGRLRNEAVRTAGTPLVAFLDDDNTLEKHHYSSLLRCMRQTGCTAVHSQRRLFDAVGRPYVTQLSPWKRDIPAAAARYAELRRHCVYVPWSNVIRDQVHGRDVPDRIQMVDTSEWLFTRDQAMATPFGEVFSQEDWRKVIGEDNKLLAGIVDGDVPVASSHMPTLHYVLGGLSNGFNDPAAANTWQAS